MKTAHLLLTAMLMLPACASKEDQPLLIFARTQNLGVNMAANVPEQGASMSVGFNDRNFAAVPVTTRSGQDIRSKSAAGNADALSVLGQFAMKANQENKSVGLGTFFSTGTAASKLGDGFAAELGYNRDCQYVDDNQVRCSPIKGERTNSGSPDTKPMPVKVDKPATEQPAAGNDPQP